MSVTREYKTGQVTQIYDADTGAVREDGGSSDLPFEQRGAQIEFQVGDSVTFLMITTPGDRRIIKEVGKKG
ncbi:MAG: hypothetical protein HUJ25_10875 [Crocinitomicaceae bacterium]|nr:hypothetical protein [Crocinitomicaceae bacterium]